MRKTFSFVLPVFLVLLSCSCGSSQDTVSENIHDQELRVESEQVDAALKALNKIQTSGDGGMKLYLTFANIEHQECELEYAYYEISQKEFREALISIMNSNNTSLSQTERNELAETASAPREYYLVKACGMTMLKGDDLPEKPFRKGTWVFVNLFQESDLLLNW